MSDTGEPDATPDATLEEAALVWLRLRARGDLAPGTLEAWLAADTRHGPALAAVEAAWLAFDDQETAPELLSMRSAALARARQAGARRWAAGGLILDRRTLITGLGGGLAAALALPVAGWWWWQLRQKAVVTGIGEQRTLTLADNSRLDLDANSRIAIAYSRDARRVDLVSGRAHFTVAKDPTRPFKVTAGSKTVTAIGTAFTVEKREGKVSVTLLEGRIAISDTDTDAGTAAAPPPREIAPHQELVMAPDTPPILRTAVDPDQSLSWREGKLFFDNESLPEVAARMNDYSHVRIRVEGEAAARIRVSGVFIAGQTDAFISALESYYPVTAAHDGDTVTISPRG